MHASPNQAGKHEPDRPSPATSQPIRFTKLDPASFSGRHLKQMILKADQPIDEELFDAFKGFWRMTYCSVVKVFRDGQGGVGFEGGLENLRYANECLQEAWRQVRGAEERDQKHAADDLKHERIQRRAVAQVLGIEVG